MATLPCPEWREQHEIYRHEVEMLVDAERLGYDTAWIAEHHFSTFGLGPAPPVLAAAIAGSTTRLNVGKAVSLVQFHDPIKLAEQLAEFRDTTRCQYLIFFTSFGGIDPTKAERSLDLLATEVIPHFR